MRIAGWVEATCWPISNQRRFRMGSEKQRRSQDRVMTLFPYEKNMDLYILYKWAVWAKVSQAGWLGEISLVQKVPGINEADVWRASNPGWCHQRLSQHEVLRKHIGDINFSICEVFQFTLCIATVKKYCSRIWCIYTHVENWHVFWVACMFVLCYTLRFHMFCLLIVSLCATISLFDSSGRLTLQDGVQEVMFGADLKPIVSSFRMKRATRWWFPMLFMFTPIWGNDPFWHIFFKWVETTS